MSPVFGPPFLGRTLPDCIRAPSVLVSCLFLVGSLWLHVQGKKQFKGFSLGVAVTGCRVRLPFGTVGGPHGLGSFLAG